MTQDVDISKMIGQTFVSVTKNLDSWGALPRELVFRRSDGSGFLFYHNQWCCEDVYIEDICGDLADLEGVPILQAEVVCSEESINPDLERVDRSFTWTFYKFATNEGSVTVRWFGASNGNHSEDVSIKYVSASEGRA